MSFYDFGNWGYLSALALIAWVPISSYVFRKKPPSQAAMFLLLHALMWLPCVAGFDFPLIPPLDKGSISILCVVGFGYAKARKRMRAARFGTGMDILVFVFLLGIFGTIFTNGDALRYGIVYLPDLTLYDGISFGLRDFISVGLPLFAGRAFIRSTEDIEDVLRVMMVAALIYTIPILYELRMSPMLHIKVYGFTTSHEWAQNVRGGGYRASVFMGHGLAVAFFMCLCTIATITLRVSGALRRYRGYSLTTITVFLLVIMVASKSAAPLIYTIFGLVMLVFTSVKTQLRLAMVFVVIVVMFPMLRITGAFPTEGLLDVAREQLGEERAESLAFRFHNEDKLLAKVQDRTAFGWGGFGRERIFDPDSGKDLTVEDGVWIIVYATRGVWGFLPFFALFLTPIVYLWMRIDRIRGRREKVLLSGVAMMLVVCAIDMLPNAGMENIPLFLAGGLFVVTRELSQRPKQPRNPLPEPVPAAMPLG